MRQVQRKHLNTLIAVRNIEKDIVDLITPREFFTGKQGQPMLKFYWGGDVTWSQDNLDNLEFIHSYVRFHIGDDAYDWDKVDEHFIKSYKQRYPTREYGHEPIGWLSPTGEFFECSYGGHTSVAKYLAILHDVPEHDEYYSYEDRLFVSGWRAIHRDGIVIGFFGEYTTVTQAQMDTLLEMVDMGYDIEYIDTFDIVEVE